MASLIETYDHHKMKYHSAFFTMALYENRSIAIKIAAVKADRNFDLLGRDIRS